MGCCCSSSAAANVGNPEQVGLNKPSGKAVDSKIIDKKVEQAQKTRVLALRECGLRKLPGGATLAVMAELKTADLTANVLIELPENVNVWLNLKSLQCSQNKLTSLPDSIGQLASLETLHLSHNALKTLPPSLSQCSKLQTLTLEGNNLGPRLPEGVFTSALSALKELVLARNDLESLPDSLGKLAGLERLIVSQNRLAALPAALGTMSKLQHLDAAENQITALSEGFLVGLASLSELWLKGNPMERLVLQKAAGFDDFLARRKMRLDNKIEANVVGRVDLTVCGLE